MYLTWPHARPYCFVPSSTTPNEPWPITLLNWKSSNLVFSRSLNTGRARTRGAELLLRETVRFFTLLAAGPSLLLPEPSESSDAPPLHFGFMGAGGLLVFLCVAGQGCTDSRAGRGVLRMLYRLYSVVYQDALTYSIQHLRCQPARGCYSKEPAYFRAFAA